MPTQKLLIETTSPPSSSPPLQEEKMTGDSLQIENYNQEQSENNSDSDSSSYASCGENDEFIKVNLADLLKEFQCPICLVPSANSDRVRSLSPAPSIIRKTRTVMECLHRFCRECIDKSMRMGNNECPTCRTHSSSRHSLRDDPNYDSLIAALYPDIDKYEEEEFAFHEDEKARNKQIHNSIAASFRQQAQTVGKKRTSATFGRSQGNHQNFRVRREPDGHDNNKDSSSSGGDVRTSQPASGANEHVCFDDRNLERN